MKRDLTTLKNISNKELQGLLSLTQSLKKNKAKYTQTLKGKTITLLGLSFKPNTDDIREAPSLSLITLLLSEGALIKTYDPVATERAKHLFPEVIFCTDVYEALEGSDGMIVVNNSFHRPQSFSLIKTSPTQSSQLFEFVGKGQDFKNGTGFYYEIKHVLEMIQQGQTESTIMPLHETISIMEIMDQIRSQHNLVYPKEQV